MRIWNTMRRNPQWTCENDANRWLVLSTGVDYLE